MEEGGKEKGTTETGDNGDREFIDSIGGTTFQCQRVVYKLITP